MKLATLNDGSRDGRLLLVDGTLTRMIPADDIAPTLQAALDDWLRCEPLLRSRQQELDQSGWPGAGPYQPEKLCSPLPRAYQWADGSAYVSHIELVRRARGAEMPPEFWYDPLIYQGGSDHFLRPTEPICLADSDWGIDFEAEVAVITGDLPMSCSEDRAREGIWLLCLVNDVSLRNLIPAELAKGFGFFQSKPASAFSPVAVTPDELGEHWDGDRLHLPLRTSLNGKPFGWPNAGVDMTFGFPALIAHAAKTRSLAAGSLIGSGTVSNRDEQVGSSCIVECRMREQLETGEIYTPFLQFGDRVRIEMLDHHNRSIFGAIDQSVIQAGSQDVP